MRETQANDLGSRDALGAADWRSRPGRPGTGEAALSRSEAIERLRAGERWALGLGWFSIGLGLAELLAPRALARLAGIPTRLRERATLRTLGAREVVTGLGLLLRRTPTGWMWGRVAGDLIDLGVLGRSIVSRKSDRSRVAGAIAAVAGVTLLDVFTATRLSRAERDADTSGSLVSGRRRARVVSHAITVDRSPDEVYHFWRKLENLPRFMAHLRSVEPIDARLSRWVAEGPAGRPIEWQAEITEDRPNAAIAWRALDGSDVLHEGVVRFLPAPVGRGTDVRVQMRYLPPAGKLGVAVAKLFGEEPSQQIAGDLRRFKQVLETGEVVHSDASIHRGMHPAQPE
jgi:uncharacterized membrane protein